MISNLNAKTLMLRMVDAAELPEDYLRDLRGFRTFSTAFKINVACHRPPQYTAFDAGKLGFDYPTYVHIAPDIEYLERAYDDAKYGSFSKRPFITPVVPTIRDHTLAPPGKHVVNLFGGHAPYELKGAGLGRGQPAEAGRTPCSTRSRPSPRAGATTSSPCRSCSPPTSSGSSGLPQGHIFHGELAPDQVFFTRPAAHYADYRTPIRGLYICGASMHPGGGVSGIPGYNAAREVLKDRGKRLN